MTTAGRDFREARSRAGGSSCAAAQILLVDDEPQIRHVVCRALARAGYAAEAVADGASGIRQGGAGRYDLVILDLGLPDIDGLDVLRAILEARPAQPVLILSCTADVPVKVECLDLGALDYLTKPFALDELVARVRTRIRGPHQMPAITKAGELVLDAGRLAADAGRGRVALTRLEFLLLRALMERAGQSVAKSDLLVCVWGIDFDPGSNIVDVCVRRLRSKLGYGLIETVRGEGYRLAC